MSAKRFSFTLLSKNASANHLESHSCKNKGLKVPCFHTLTKNIGGQGAMRRLRVPIPSGRGVRLGDSVIPLARRHEGSEPAILASDEGSQCSAGREPQSVNRESPVTNHEPLRLSPLTSTLTKNASASPLTSTLTKTKDLKSFNINTYKKGVGVPRFWKHFAFRLPVRLHPMRECQKSGKSNAEPSVAELSFHGTRSHSSS